MAAANAIRDIASTSGFHGGSNFRQAEPAPERNLSSIDNSTPGAPNVNTSVDCYVSGEYPGKNGKTLAVRQRYTIFVSYSRQTQAQTLNDVRGEILKHFQSKYGSSFNVTDIDVNARGMPIPMANAVGQMFGNTDAEPGMIAPAEFYWGSGTFRNMTRFERARFDISTQRKIADINVKSIKERYKYGK
jgi:hypothetical protein